ncbi:MAG: IS30 family transposase [Candidatus Electrothrix sp. YB6]
MTFDNGKEFALHEEITEKIECGTYFAKPYHSREGGQNENANGLLRQYFPKNIELVDITVQQVVSAVDKLNSRPRKCLQSQTPYEVFEKLTGVDVSKIMGYALMLRSLKSLQLIRSRTNSFQIELGLQSKVVHLCSDF